MNREGIERLLASLGTQPSRKQRRKGWVIASCPLAPWHHAGGRDRNPSFGIKIKDDGLSMFNCYTCGHGGPLLDLVREWAGQIGDDPRVRPVVEFVSAELEGAEISPVKEWEQIEEDEDIARPWPEEVLQQYSSVAAYRAAWSYLGRRLNLDDRRAIQFANDNGILYDPQRYRLLFTIRDWYGQLMGLHSRTVANGDPPYLIYKYDPAEPNDPWSEDGIYNRAIWIGENYVDPAEPVLLTEGPVDWLSARRVYANSLCGISAGLGWAKVQRLKNTCRLLVTAFDVGTGGNRAREYVSKHLGAHATIVDLIPPAEFKDLGAMQLESVRALLSQALNV